jgi:hypothetical protein
MTSIDEQIAKIKTHTENIETEYNSLKSGRKSAAPRLRKSLLNLKKEAHTMRASTTEFLHSLPTQKKNKILEPETVPLVVEPAHAPEPEPAQKTKPRKRQLKKV